MKSTVASFGQAVSVGHHGLRDDIINDARLSEMRKLLL